MKIARLKRRFLGLLGVVASPVLAFSQPTTNPASAPQVPAPLVASTPPGSPALTDWWRKAVFYEIFVRSFADSTSGPLAGDGIGDLQGIIERLDYLNDGNARTDSDLGVTALWLMPIMQSPSYHGYDISDYRTVHKEYGTNDDLRRLITECHKRGVRVILDLVINHCSWDHPWFIDAMDPKSPRHEWFVWERAIPAWKGPWGQDAWHPHPKLGPDGGFYYGLFWKGMPDINLRNPDATAAVVDVAKFWLDAGVDGFRLDAIRHLIEKGEIQENTQETHDWLRGFQAACKLAKKDAFTVGEVWSPSEQVVTYVGDQMDTAFEFWTAGATLKAVMDGKSEELARQWSTVQSTYPRGQYATFLSNHDQIRVMSVLGGGNGHDRQPVAGARRAEASAKLAAALLLTTPGIPFIYYGEEIGMVGVKPDEDLRTPMQWTSRAGAGFTTSAKPWRPLNRDASARNVDIQTRDAGSLLSLYRHLVRLRFEHPALSIGTMTPIKASVPEVFAYLREEEGEVFLFVANLSSKPVRDYHVTLHAGLPPRATDAINGRRLSNTAPGAYKPAGELPAHGWLLMQLTDVRE